MRKRSDKVEDNRQVEAELVLTAALTTASRAAGHCPLYSAKIKLIWYGLVSVTILRL